MGLKAWLVTNLENKEQKIIFLAKDPGTAASKSGWKQMEVQSIAEASDYLGNEKKYQEEYLK